MPIMVNLAEKGSNSTLNLLSSAVYVGDPVAVQGEAFERVVKLTEKKYPRERYCTLASP